MPPQFTTTLRHGLPSTMVACFADQPAWGRTLAISMGAIADNPSFRQRARELQQMLAGEDGVANDVAEIEARLI
jgi:UDP:flavonoid glycosyltransferase YjiC (YdhE family)